MEVVWENDQVMVINKPKGMVCVREENPKKWPVVAHRLDKETSGCLLMAKDPETLKFLMNEFRQRRVDKTYLALVHGILEPETGKIKLPLGTPDKGNFRQGVRFDGKMAETEWRVLKRFNNLSFLRVRTYTGRKHQIRAHLAHLGYPLFSDSRYLNKRQLAVDRKRLNRQFLHAERLKFSLPSGEKKEVVIKLPEELRKLVYGNKKIS